MADTSLTTIAGILKRRYDDMLVTQQNLKHRAMDSIAKSLSKKSPGGAGFYGAMKDYGNESVGAINEEEQFRSIDSEHASQWVVTPKVLTGPIQFSGLSTEAAKGDDDSFVDAVLDALDSARERLLKDENRQFFGYGTGVMGAPGGAVASAAVSFSVSGVQYFRANQVIDILTSVGGSAIVSSARIAEVDRPNSRLIFAAPIAGTLATTNVIVKENILDSAAADGKEMMGLRGIVDDATDLTTFQGISVNSTLNLIWRARRIDASSANLSSDLLQRLIDDVAVNCGEEPDTLIAHRTQRRKYLDIVVPQKRYADGKMDSGFSELTFNGKEMILDEDCQTDTVYAIRKKLIHKFELKALAMGSHDGSDVFTRLANYDVFQAYWRHYCNFGTSQRNAHGKLIGLAVPTALS